MKRYRIISLLILALSVISCQKDKMPDTPENVRKTFILYSDGYNNLTPYMRDDIVDISSSAPQDTLRYRLLVLSHFTKTAFNYWDDSSPILEDIWRDSNGNVVRDTVKFYPSNMNTACAESLYEVLDDISHMYPSKEYEFMLSSHGTGWLPIEYYDIGEKEDEDDPDEFVFSASPCNAARTAKKAAANSWLLRDPVTKSLGCCAYYDAKGLRTHEIDVHFLPSAFPSHMKFGIILLDACLMGGVEVAYALRNVAPYIIASQCEIMAGGYDYVNILDRALYRLSPALQEICDDFCNQNKNDATISAISCAHLDNLASVCKYIFTRYSDNIAHVDPSAVQPFFRNNKHWFYDLRDILVKSGVGEDDMAAFDEAISKVVVYERHTPTFLGVIKLDTNCGLSMFLPCHGSPYLRDYYKDYGWNIATSLVR